MSVLSQQGLRWLCNATGDHSAVDSVNALAVSIARLLKNDRLIGLDQRKELPSREHSRKFVNGKAYNSVPCLFIIKRVLHRIGHVGTHDL